MKRGRCDVPKEKECAAVWQGVAYSEMGGLLSGKASRNEAQAGELLYAAGMLEAYKSIREGYVKR